MKTRLTILSLLLIIVAAPGFAETWTLEQCVEYARTHNLQIKLAEIRTTQSELAITEAKDRFLPTLRANAGESFSFGRGLTANNTYADRNTSNFQWGVSLDLPLFQGLNAYRQLNVAKENLRMMVLECESTKDNITLNIISQYLQVLYNKELIAIADNQLALSQYEVERRSKLVEHGKIPESDLLDIEAQKAQDELQVVTANTNYDTSLVELANLLQLPSAANFDISPIEELTPTIPSAETVYNRALAVNNGILASQQNIKVADSRISLAQCGYIPQLSFGSSVGSSYYTLGGTVNEPFNQQMRHNFSTYLGFTLSIPIFDAFSTRNNVRQARLNKLSAEFELENQQAELYKTIQLAYSQAIGARAKYFASLTTLDKTKLSFEATAEKYNLGRATPYDYEQAKSNLNQVEITSLQAHYEYLMRYRLLLYYQNNRL